MTNVDDNPYLRIRQAFDAPWPGPRGERIHLQAGDLSLTLYPDDGCRITSLIARGYELLRQWNPHRRGFQYGCFPMIPWVGRLAHGKLQYAGASYALPVNKPPHALHGMACFAPWRTRAVSKNAAEFEFSLGEPWPWAGKVIQKISIKNNEVHLNLQIETERDPFPAAAGWHPWFSKWIGDPAYVESAPMGDAEAALQLVFSSDWQEESGADELPTGQRIAVRPGPWDDCFGFKGTLQCTLRWPEKISLAMTSSASHLVIFDKPADASCVNPLSGPPNGVNTAAEIVSPERPLIISTVWRLLP